MIKSMSCRTGSKEVNPNLDLFNYVPQIGAFDWVALEGLMYQFWKPDTITAERKRIRQCWYDYRHIHPVMRSFVFVREYERAHQRAFKRYYGVSKDPFGDLPRGSQRTLYARSQYTIRQVVLKMHLIDELGAPYDTYFDAAFDHMMQERGYETYWRKNKAFSQHILPPINTLADARSMIAGQKFVERRNDIKLCLPKHPHYFASNWIGSISQKQCSKWLISEAKRRPDRTIALSRLTYELNLLREHEVVRYLGVAEVKRMRSMSA